MQDKEKLLYIIAGANGSGKSTLAESLLKEKNLEFLNADNIAKEISPDAIDKVPISAGKIYFKRLYKFFKENKSFAIETTLSGKNIEKIILTARKNDYKIVLIYIYLNNFVSCIKRVKSRVLNGGHDVPETDITRRYFKSIINFWYLYKDTVDEWSLFYNGEFYKPYLIATEKCKKCDIIDNEKYSRFIEMLNNIKENIQNEQ